MSPIVKNKSLLTIRIFESYWLPLKVTFIKSKKEIEEHIDMKTAPV